MLIFGRFIAAIIKNTIDYWLVLLRLLRLHRLLFLGITVVL